jgi:AcrR family transcriptional regulator
MLFNEMATVRLTRQEKQEQTRQAILRSAATLFAHKGVEGTSVQEIAEHAGLTQGAIYSNFKSKADLWFAIADAITRTIDPEQLFPGERDFSEELRDAGVAGARLLRDIPRTNLLLDQEFNMFLMRHPRAKARYRREVREMHREMAAMLERVAAKRGKPLPARAELIARLVDVVSRGLIQQFVLDPDSVDEELCAAAFEMIAGCSEDS